MGRCIHMGAAGALCLGAIAGSMGHMFSPDGVGRMNWYVRGAALGALGLLLWWLVSGGLWDVASLILVAAALGAVAGRPKPKPGYKPIYWVKGDKPQ